MEKTLDAEVNGNRHGPIALYVPSGHLYGLVEKIFGPLGQDYAIHKGDNPYFHGWDDRVPETRFGVPNDHPLHPCAFTLSRDDGTSRLVMEPKTQASYDLLRKKLSELRAER